MGVHGMKISIASVVGSFAILAMVLVGCGGSSTKSKPIQANESAMKSADRWLATQPFKDQANAAIAIRGTIQPSRFETGTSQLNRLGTREIRVLATRYKTDPGELSVARGDSDDALYAKRVKAVMTELAANGVDTARMVINENPPGGTGMASVDVIRIVEKGRSERLRPEQGQVLGQAGGSEPVE